MGGKCLLFQMGKVGSGSIRQACQTAGLPVLHTHSPDEAKHFCGHNTGVFVVTGIRDFLVRTVSAFFQNLDNPDNAYWYLGDQKALHGISVATLIAEFRQRYPRHLDEKVLPWFDQFAALLDFPLFNQAFDRQTGVQLYPHTPPIIVYRFENLPRLEGMLRDYSHCPIELGWTNRGAEKWYASLYADFKRQIRFSPAELDLFYDNRPMRHFYTPREIEAMRGNWG
jgi:hypothetical protein